MNIMIKDEDASGESSERVQSRLEGMLQKLSIKALRSAETVLQEQLLATIQKSYCSSAEEGSSHIAFLEFFLFSLINRIDKLQQLATINIVREDYETLETAVQKAEAEIRKHIRIEQQLKIYLDSLEEKVEELEEKLENEEAKYGQLFETLRQMEEQRRELQKRVEGRDGQRSKPSSSNFSTINQQAYKEYLVGRRKGSKGRPTQKLPERGRRGSEKQPAVGKQAHFAQGAIQINLSNNIVVSKKNSYDQHLPRHNHVSNDASIRELTKTVQMKQAIHSQEKPQARPNRKVSKYRTETAQEGRKQFRSSSVCY